MYAREIRTQAFGMCGRELQHCDIHLPCLGDLRKVWTCQQCVYVLMDTFFNDWSDEWVNISLFIEFTTEKNSLTQGARHLSKNCGRGVKTLNGRRFVIAFTQNWAKREFWLFRRISCFPSVFFFICKWVKTSFFSGRKLLLFLSPRGINREILMWLERFPKLKVFPGLNLLLIFSGRMWFFLFVLVWPTTTDIQRLGSECDGGWISLAD